MSVAWPFSGFTPALISFRDPSLDVAAWGCPDSEPLLAGLPLWSWSPYLWMALSIYSEAKHLTSLTLSLTVEVRHGVYLGCRVVLRIQ